MFQNWLFNRSGIYSVDRGDEWRNKRTVTDLFRKKEWKNKIANIAKLEEKDRKRIETINTCGDFIVVRNYIL